MKTMRRAGAVILALSLVAAACGDDTSTAPTDDTTSPSSTAPADVDDHQAEPIGLTASHTGVTPRSSRSA